MRRQRLGYGHTQGNRRRRVPQRTTKRRSVSACCDAPGAAGVHGQHRRSRVDGKSRRSPAGPPRQRNDDAPMPNDGPTSPITRESHPSHHSGPGYAEHPIAREFEQTDEVTVAIARWLDYVPSEHRHRPAKSDKHALETLQEHMRTCSEHPLRALWTAHRHLKEPSTRSGSRPSCSRRRRSGIWSTSRMPGLPPRPQSKPTRIGPGALAPGGRALPAEPIQRLSQVPRRPAQIGQPVRPCMGATRPGQGLARSG